MKTKYDVGIIMKISEILAKQKLPKKIVYKLKRFSNREMQLRFSNYAKSQDELKQGWRQILRNKKRTWEE